MEEKVKAYMDAHDMLPPGGGRVLAACSGGADSTALLHLLRHMDGAAVVCAHFNHRLRGAESDRDEAFVRGLCAAWGVEFYAGAADVAAWAKEQKLGVEAAARELRYRFLQETAKTAGCACIATAHTADDNAETVLLHLLRGAGARGLSGIPPVREDAGVKLVRPLLHTTRAEVEDYLRRHGVPHVEDSSNRGDEYARNRLRHAVMPLLAECAPDAVEKINAAAETLREDEAYLDGRAAAFLAAHQRGGAAPVPALLALGKPVAMRVLKRLRPGAGRAHLEALYALCQSAARKHAALDLPGGRVARDGETLYFGALPVLEADVPRREVRPGETAAIPELGKAVRCAATEYTKEIHKTFNTFYFQSEKICGRMYAACRAPGDAIRFQGRNCTKTVKKLFSEAALPLTERARRLVLSDGIGPIAVEGFPGVAERCAPEVGKPAIKIEILETVSPAAREETEKWG